MQYRLVTGRGDVMHFTVLSCAELFQQAFGGHIEIVNSVLNTV